MKFLKAFHFQVELIVGTHAILFKAHCGAEKRPSQAVIDDKKRQRNSER